MQPIQAIICFNGGSAGDLIKKLALLCYNIDNGFVRDNGLVDHPPYFKLFFADAWTGKVDVNNIDWNQILPIENTHYYFNYYTKISKSIFFIDYEDSINPIILSEYIRKRHFNNLEIFLEQHISSLPDSFRNKINTTNCKQIFELQWLKNLRAWRANLNLTPINFYDILQRDTALNVVETITGQKVKNIDKFDFVYNSWLKLNENFRQLTP